MLTMPQSSVLPKLSIDSESLSLSESCVRSDIVDIIRKIYSPRPVIPDVAADSAVESKDNVKDCMTISRPKEEEEKRFGFHFESVTGHFAKTIVDSSTTSGSVSVPIVRYKPKRLRNVCDCCKQKIPHHVDETRAKRACRDCRICKRNYYSILRNSSSFVGVREEIDQTVENSIMKDSNYEIVRIKSEEIPNEHNSNTRVLNYEVRLHPGSRFTMQDQTQPSPMNLERKQSFIDLTKRLTGNILRNENIENGLDCSSVSYPQVFPNSTNNQKVTITPTISSDRPEEVKVRNTSFIGSIMSKLICKNIQSGSLEEGVRPSIHKTDNPKYTEKKSSKTSMRLEKAEKSGINKHLQANLADFDSVVFSKERLLPEKEMRKSTFIKEQNQESIPTLTNEKDKLEKVTVDSSPGKIPSQHNIEKSPVDNDVERQDFAMPVEDIERTSSIKEMKDEVIKKCNEKQQKKYQVAYKSLTIEVDTNWAYEFWAGVFGTCHSVISFFTAFFLHFLTFVLQSLIQPLLCGTVRISSEHFFKPCLSTAFESVIQPVCKLIERLVGSLRDVCLPVAQCFGVFCNEVSHICKAFRIVEINKNYHFNGEAGKL